MPTIAEFGKALPIRLRTTPRGQSKTRISLQAWAGSTNPLSDSPGKADFRSASKSSESLARLDRY